MRVCVCVPSAESVGARGCGVSRWGGGGMFNEARSPARPSRHTAVNVNEVSSRFQGSWGGGGGGGGAMGGAVVFQQVITCLVFSYD